MTVKKLGVVGVLVLGAVGAVTACGSTTIRRTFDDADSALPDTTDASGTTDGPSLLDPDAAAAGKCPEGSETKITGKVFDPAGKNPLYNIQVFVPSGELPVIPVGIPDPDPATSRCAAGRTCDSEILNPLAAGLSNTKGEFELKGPKLFPGKDVPLVMQIGKWRRKIVIPEVKACTDNKLDKSVTRLPKNGSEGDMPQIALTTGCDALECLLLGIGIDAAEFEAGNSGPAKHVHMFRGAGVATPLNPRLEAVNGKTLPLAETLWSGPDRMQPFDIAMLSCECNEYAPGGTGTPVNKPPGMRTMQNYTNWGGRVFGTHYHYSWMKYNDGWKNGILDFSHEDVNPTQTTFPINTSFPKGQALADWLVEVGVSTTPAQITIDKDLLRESHGGAVPGSPAQEWIGKGTKARYVSFNTPSDAPANAQCGRFVFSDIHSTISASPNFPTSCSALNKAQLPLEYMFFDLSSCVQDETKPPEPPK